MAKSRRYTGAQTGWGRSARREMGPGRVREYYSGIAPRPHSASAAEHPDCGWPVLTVKHGPLGSVK